MHPTSTRCWISQSIVNTSQQFRSPMPPFLSLFYIIPMRGMPGSAVYTLAPVNIQTWAFFRTRSRRNAVIDRPCAKVYATERCFKCSLRMKRGFVRCAAPALLHASVREVRCATQVRRCGMTVMRMVFTAWIGLDYRSSVMSHWKPSSRNSLDICMAHNSHTPVRAVRLAAPACVAARHMVRTTQSLSVGHHLGKLYNCEVCKAFEIIEVIQ